MFMWIARIANLKNETLQQHFSDSIELNGICGLVDSICLDHILWLVIHDLGFVGNCGIMHILDMIDLIGILKAQSHSVG